MSMSTIGVPLEGFGAYCRAAAAEGAVLLKNEGHMFPLKKEEMVSVFGRCQFETYRSGTGSGGAVNVPYAVNIYDGMRESGSFTLNEELADIYRAWLKDHPFDNGGGGWAAEPWHQKEMVITEEIAAAAAEKSEKAIFIIGRTAGEDKDYANEAGSYLLTPEELENLKVLTAHFEQVAVLLNVSNIIDMSWLKNPVYKDHIRSVLYIWQGGMESGNAVADVLSGKVSPSGKLTDTIACSLADYSAANDFGDTVRNFYTEDIYVGYRYFETIPGAAERVNYPFGFGLSYTDFDWKMTGASEENGVITVLTEVTNTGKTAGKEVIQLYYGAPQGKLGKPAKVLGAFKKTSLLQPGERQILTLKIPVDQMASYDDLGKVCRSAYVLEAGEYAIYIGTNVRDAAKIDFTYVVKEDTVTEQLSRKAAPYHLQKRMLADGSYEELPQREYVEEEGLPRQDKYAIGLPCPDTRGQKGIDFLDFLDSKGVRFSDVADGKMTLDEFMDILTLDDCINLLGGQPNTGCANTFGMGNLPEYGVPNVMTADGPAGLRILPKCGVNTTAWPCATLLASTWDEELVEKVGKAGAEEVKENNISIWLTPACNIHRSPLCGRNFEYYSEDPYLAGKTGAAMVRGIQSQHIGASVKHFAANNKETNRKDSDSRVSERALREIYLKQFEIIVKEAHPYTIMSSYNLINGIHASENKELLTGILRDEWGFDGLVTTDWWTFGEHYRETKAGNDIKMAAGYPERIKEAYEKGFITEEEICRSARRILNMILKID